MSPPKVFIADSISQRGIDELTHDGALEANVQTGLSETQLAEAIPDFAALIIRSQTKVTAKILNAAKKLRVVGRAGVGVDNVDAGATDHAQFFPRVQNFRGHLRFATNDERSKIWNGFG